MGDLLTKALWGSIIIITSEEFSKIYYNNTDETIIMITQISSDIIMPRGSGMITPRF